MSMMEMSSKRPAVTLNAQPIDTPEMQQRETTVDVDAMTPTQLNAFLSDIRDEPAWRRLADRCADYYDGNQLTDDILADFRKYGLPPLTINLIQPTINTVLGMEAKTRTDPEVTFQDEALEPVAQALSKKLLDAKRESKADRAISNAYAGQTKAGLHWVEVGWHSNPFAYRYRVTDVHRREIWWDWRRREIDEWRYLVRKRRFDRDQITFAFPKMQGAVDAAFAGGLDWQMWAQQMDQTTGLGAFLDLERAITFDEQEWINRQRNELTVFEVWYRKITRGYVARLGETTIEIDQQNPRHMLAIANGVMKPTLAIFPKLRQAIFVGPVRVLDRPTPLPHRRIPYIPFFGFREDLTGVPYGLIRAMLSPQDEINARRSKAMALMNSRRVQADADALDGQYNTHEDAADEVSLPNSYIVLNQNRKNLQHGFHVEDNADLAAGQASILDASKNEIHEVSGVFPPMAGDNRGGLSGVAIDSLVEQGTQTLAEINDNYIWSRREVFDQKLELVKWDSQHEHEVAIGEGKNRKVITLNEKMFDNNLGEYVTHNQVNAAQVNLVLQEVPATPAYRAQQSRQLAEITKSLPPQMQAFVVPFFIESTDIRERKKIAAILRKQLGIPDPGMEDQQQAPDPEKEQLKQQLQGLQQQHQEIVGKLTDQAQKAVADSQALQVKLASREEETRVKAAKVAADADVQHERNDIERQKAEDARLNALANVERSEFPKGGGADNSSTLQDAIEELLVTTRTGFQEFHGRVSAIEKHIGKSVAGETATSSAAPATPPVKPTAPAPVVIHNHIDPSTGVPNQGTNPPAST